MRLSIFLFGSYRYGLWTVRVGPWAVQLKAGWNAPLFSERNGFNCKKLSLFKGWRFVFWWKQT